MKEDLVVQEILVEQRNIIEWQLNKAMQGQDLD